MKQENYNFSFTFIVWLALAIFLLVYSVANVNAATINPYSIKNGNTTGYYDIIKYQSSDMLKVQTYGQVGTNYNVSYVQTLLNFKTSITNGYYDLKINFTNSNFVASSIQAVYVVGYTSAPTNIEYNASLGTTLDLVYLKNNKSTNSTNSIIVRFLSKTLQNFSHFQVFLVQDYRQMSVGISSLDLSQVDDNQAIKDLENNQNTNRDLIINNITNSIDNSLNNCTQNLLNGNNLNSDGSYVIDGTFDKVTFINLGSISFEPGNYTLFLKNNNNYNITLNIDMNRNLDTATRRNFSLTSSLLSGISLRIAPGTYNNLVVYPSLMTGHTNNYAKPNDKFCTSKVDDINDSINSDDDDTTSKKCGVVCKLKGIFTGIIELPGKIANLIKGLFVPENFDFINDFKDVMISKLGILAQVPDMLLSFLNDIKNKEYTKQCFTMPKMSFFGYSFWQEMNFCIQDGFYYNIIKDYRWMTNFVPVFGVIFYCYNAYKKFFGEGDSE